MTRTEKWEKLNQYCRHHRCATCPAGVLLDDIYDGFKNEDCLVTALMDTVEGDEE